VYAQSVSEFHDDVQGGVPAATFEAADIRTVKPDVVGERLL